LDREIDEFCARYAQAYPGNQFAVRKISPRWYNIVWVGESAVYPNGCPILSEGPQRDDL
jgi:hypothetical protein